MPRLSSSGKSSAIGDGLSHPFAPNRTISPAVWCAGGAPPEAKGPRARIALTVRQAAEALQVSTSTVYQLCAQGRLPHFRVSNAIRIEPSALEWFCANRAPAMDGDAQPSLRLAGRTSTRTPGPRKGPGRAKSCRSQ